MVTELRQTYEDLMRQTDESVRHELVRGEIVCMTPPKGRHGRVESALDRGVGRYLRERALALGWEDEQGLLACDLLVGASAIGEFGIRITLPDDSDQVRGLDFCYLSAEQVARYEATGPDEYFTEVPVLVAEVISPSESADYIAEKVHDFLTGGARLVWLLFPRTRMVQIYEPDRPMRVLTGDARLDGGEVLPGFSAPLGGLFP